MGDETKPKTISVHVSEMQPGESVPAARRRMDRAKAATVCRECGRELSETDRFTRKAVLEAVAHARAYASAPGRSVHEIRGFYEGTLNRLAARAEGVCVVCTYEKKGPA